MAKGSVARRGTSWRARYRHPETGRQHQATFRRQADAQRWLRAELSAIDVGGWTDPRAGRVTLADYYEHWSARQVWASGTEKAMSLAVRSAPFADLELAKIRHTHVEAWIKAMSVGTSSRRALAPGTIKTRVVNVRSVLRAAVRDELIAKDPSDGVRLPRQRKRAAAMTIPTPGEVGELLDAADSHFVAFVAVAAFAGLRLGEAAALQLDDVDFLGRRIKVQRQVQRAGHGRVELSLPKYGSEREVPAPPQLLEILARHVELGPSGEWLFGGVDADPPHQNTVGYQWRQTLAAAGTGHFRLHDLRHFYASGLIASGCDVVTVQRALGHAKATTTLETYSHLWPSAEDRTRTAAAILAGEVLSAGVGKAWAEEQK